jgi:hypothetical protein
MKWKYVEDPIVIASHWDKDFVIHKVVFNLVWLGNGRQKH